MIPRLGLDRRVIAAEASAAMQGAAAAGSAADQLLFVGHIRCSVAGRSGRAANP